MALTPLSEIRTFSSATYSGVTSSNSDKTEDTAETVEPTDQSEKNGSIGKKKTNERSEELDRAEIREIERLKKRDQEVIAHEMAHMAVGGRYVRGGASFQYQYGPDGRQYAVGGEVGIDMSTIPGDPEATAAKMRTVISAALAPASPSGQDRMVAARASRIAMEMEMELIQLKMAEANKGYRKAIGAASISNASSQETGSSASGETMQVVA